jgi:hypothetical protein
MQQNQKRMGWILYRMSRLARITRIMLDHAHVPQNQPKIKIKRLLWYERERQKSPLKVLVV